MATKFISDLDYECPVCLDKILPPVFQCINGHILCDNCQKKLKHCPVCRKRFLAKDRIRCLEVERIIKMQEHSCPHFHKGCRSELNWNEIREHELDCMYASLNYCKLMGIKSCSVTVSRQELLNHFALFHSNDNYVRYMVWDGHLQTPYNFTMPLPEANYKKTEYIVFAVREHDCLYIFALAIRLARGRVTYVPYIMGSQTTASSYSCQIQLGGAAEPMCSKSGPVPVFSIIDYKTADKCGSCLNIPRTDLRKISTVSTCNAWYQMRIKFHRNSNQDVSETSRVLPTEAAAPSTTKPSSLMDTS